MADYSITNKNLTYDIFPNEAGATTFPIVFPESIPFYIKMQVSYRQISNSHIFAVEFNISGTLNGFTQNRFIPYIRIYAENSSYFYAWDLSSANLSNISGTVKVYENGALTSTTNVDASNINWFNTYTRNTEIFDLFNVNINEVSIPVIFNSINPEQPDMYYYNGQFDALTVSSGYDYKKCLNGKEDEEVPDGEDFILKIQWTVGNWTSNEQPPVNFVNWECIRGRFYDGKLALYKIKGIDDGHLKYGIKQTCTLFNLEYSNDGTNWTSTDTIPYEFVHRKRVNELGEFGYALTMQNEYLPIFKNEDDADDYIDDILPISEADNWDDISPAYPPENQTEEEDDETDMGEVYTRAFFSQQYICPVGALQEISNAFFDTDSGGITGIVDDIIKGLRMYGNDITQAVQGCVYYPINLNEIFTDTMSQNYIYFGGYRFNLQSSSVNRIIHPNGYKYFGSFFFKSTFGTVDRPNYRDYEPYQRLFCYLAYIGWVQLDIARYINKTVSVKYYFDTRTNGCMACLFANDVLVDYFNGQCGVSMPITLTDYSAYASAQIRTLLGLNSASSGDAGVVGDFAKNVGSGLVESGAMSAGVFAGGLLAGGAMVAGTKTLYNLTQNNINNFNKTKGGSTSMLNQYLPQEILFMLEIQDADETPNEISLQGYPSNASGQIQSFNGYLEVDAVKLVCSGATANEKAEIIKQLQNGIYI